LLRAAHRHMTGSVEVVKLTWLLLTYLHKSTRSHMSTVQFVKQQD
jgi:hypothetical protein